MRLYSAINPWINIKADVEEMCDMTKLFSSHTIHLCLDINSIIIDAVTVIYLFIVGFPLEDYMWNCFCV